MSIFFTKHKGVCKKNDISVDLTFVYFMEDMKNELFSTNRRQPQGIVCCNVHGYKDIRLIGLDIIILNLFKLKVNDRHLVITNNTKSIFF